MPISSEAARARAKIAGLSRAVRNGERPAGGPELDQAHRDLEAAVFVDRVAKLVAAAPPLTDEQRARISALLRTGAAVTHDVT